MRHLATARALLASGLRTPDMGGKASMEELGKAITAEI
jgi:isocitrate/isopropylmalate dehydrogenase